MTTMTIHVEDEFAETLREHARSLGVSVNRAVKDMLAPLLGLTKKKSKKDNPFMKYCGIISHEEAERLRKVVAEQRQIEWEMWK